MQIFYNFLRCRNLPYKILNIKMCFNTTEYFVLLSINEGKFIKFVWGEIKNEVVIHLITKTNLWLENSHYTLWFITYLGNYSEKCVSR